MIYLDNAATTFPKPKSVIKATFECINKYCGNPGRSSHKLSVKTSEKIFEAREAIADLIGIDRPENIVFTENATSAINIAIKTTVTPTSHVIISDLEHNSVFRPLYTLTQKSGVTYSVFDSSGDVYKNIEKLIQENTRCIISTLASNVTGKEIPLDILSKVAKKYNLSLITDASQKIGHKKIDLRVDPTDVICAPSHKALFGIQGAGFVAFNDGKIRDTVFEGGSGNDSLNPLMPEFLPERFEAGTLPSPSIISMLEGIKFIKSVKIEEIESKINLLTERCNDILYSFKNITVYGGENGVISFNIAGLSSEFVSRELDRCGICTRSGLHCAPLAHKTIGTLESGTVRIGLSYLNTKRELDKLYGALYSIIQRF